MNMKANDEGVSMPRALRTLSIVSHRHGPLVSALLDDVERHCAADLEVVLVVNVPEDEAYLSRPRPFPVTVIRNAAPRGFGANHNLAYSASRGDVFVIVNPDIRFSMDPLQSVLHALKDPRVGLCAPVVLSPEGGVEDSARRFPSISTLIRRTLFRKRGLDYDINDAPVSVDWVAGMFVACRRELYGALGGFDENYFMYFEDVDLCRRVRQMGLDVRIEPGARVVHDARRQSHKSLKHMSWHLRSAFRFLFSREVGSA
jgi:N-acetylglucosaminyl-diphospho-decaprenol L-rhamnosyltransferase